MTRNQVMGIAMGIAAVVIVAVGVLIWQNGSNHYTTRSDQSTSVTTSPQINPRETK